MVSKVNGLGRRGLDGLFGDKKVIIPPVVKGEVTTEIPLKDLQPNPYQPRKVFDVEQLRDLVNSIKERGIIQPLIIRKKGKNYEIVAGERRWRAAKEAQLQTVPAVIRDYDDAAMMEVALVENVQRADLNPIEEAEGIKAMMDKLGLTQTEVAKKLGMNRTKMSTSLRLLSLPAKVQGYVSARKLSLGQVKPLLTINDAALVEQYAERAVAEHWPAKVMEEAVAKRTTKLLNRKLEALVVEAKPKDNVRSIPAVAPVLDVHAREFQEKLTELLGTKVKVENSRGGKGRIIIEYYSPDDLERVCELLQRRTLDRKSGMVKEFSV